MVVIRAIKRIKRIFDFIFRWQYVDCKGKHNYYYNRWTQTRHVFSEPGIPEPYDYGWLRGEHDDII